MNEKPPTIKSDPESQPKYQVPAQREAKKIVDAHAPTCKHRSDREGSVKTACGLTMLVCWLPTHWDLCSEQGGACFQTPAQKDEKPAGQATDGWKVW